MRLPTPEERETIEHYANLDLDSLWVTLGRAAHRAEGAQFSPGTARDRGKEWFESVRGDLHRTICEVWGYCEKRSDERLKDSVTLITTISDLITASCGGLPVLAVATLLVKMGLDRFCECDA